MDLLQFAQKVGFENFYLYCLYLERANKYLDVEKRSDLEIMTDYLPWIRMQDTVDEVLSRVRPCGRGVEQ